MDFDTHFKLNLEKSECICGNKTSSHCGNCKIQKYCSKECQKNHWKEHKFLCNDIHHTNINSDSTSPELNITNVVKYTKCETIKIIHQLDYEIGENMHVKRWVNEKYPCISYIYTKKMNK